MSAPVGRALLASTTRRARVAVINLMPRAETYEALLVAALGPSVHPVWVRLATHGYQSSDAGHLAARYVAWGDAGPLDAVLLTGAPVETLPFTDVRYWDELRALLADARSRDLPVLGLCWGAMALASLFGIVKVNLPKKVFGAFEHPLTEAGRGWLPTLGGRYRCAQSRHAGLDEASVTWAERDHRVLRLAHAPATGTTLLATPDFRVVMHLGHPEYDASRIAYEWARDRAAGRGDVDPPVGFDGEGVSPMVPWARDSVAFFEAWRATFAWESVR